MKKKVFQFNKELYKVTGIQKVLMDIHEALRTEFDCKIVGEIPYEKVNKNLEIAETDYVRYKNPLMFRNSIVIIHERRLLPLMWILMRIPGLNVKCIYIHHNELYGNKLLSLFPKNIVAISDAGIKNLTKYFGVKYSAITKIHNCVREYEAYVKREKKFDSNNVTILYPARINDVKRQIEIVKHLKGKLDNRVKILFAGTGPLLNELNDICEGDEQFQVLGFRDDIPELMQNSDFVMLFSKHEGLPISLIEATQRGIPVICNSVGGNEEIIRDGENGIICNDWDSLLNTLNTLPAMTQDIIDCMSENGRRAYLNNFNFKIFKNNYIKLIKSVE
ncbi:glycosyltransferase family 4 protein [Lepagella muris]|jgi:glycosyltransferase involved in cell wall biosynthesis|uniref:Glycosyltransferase n=1 Tax=Lepagella muris TaxID=3032870 RepID=A0AC61RER7_9BACT|nr:glycosyltransferase family 4 protein [Lepagella muris]TGY77475.1 glycosyltransferase [Lepagella muris]THG50123.1 glycosyltransferase family 4 protein [Bacteroidales bacterium]TKC60461.1 glycosyltransferase family 4 protein [Bacteroidales bacterium]